MKTSPVLSERTHANTIGLLRSILRKEEEGEAARILIRPRIQCAIRIRICWRENIPTGIFQRSCIIPFNMMGSIRPGAKIVIVITKLGLVRSMAKKVASAAVTVDRNCIIAEVGGDNKSPSMRRVTASHPRQIVIPDKS
jgi:hypothetical protein